MEVLALEQLQVSFSDIGAHQDLQLPELSMPELLLKELCAADNSAPWKFW